MGHDNLDAVLYEKMQNDWGTVMDVVDEIFQVRESKSIIQVYVLIGLIINDKDSDALIYIVNPTQWAHGFNHCFYFWWEKFSVKSY